MIYTEDDLRRDYGERLANDYLERVKHYAYTQGLDIKMPVYMARKWLIRDNHQTVQHTIPQKEVKEKETERIDIMKKYERERQAHIDLTNRFQAKIAEHKGDMLAITWDTFFAPLICISATREEVVLLSDDPKWITKHFVKMISDWLNGITVKVVGITELGGGK